MTHRTFNRTFLDFATEAAWQAGQLTLAQFQTGVAVELKSDESPVTIADRGAEELLRRLIEKRFPDHAIFGEELGQTERDSTYRWIIDPIDGTRSFIRGVPLYDVLIGLEIGGEMAIGVAHFPGLGEMIAAARGEGCRWNASALMQAPADRYFILPYTVGHYLAGGGMAKIDANHPAVKDAEREVTERTKRLLSAGGTKSADELHRELGNVMWNDCGMARSKESLTHALQVIPELREKFWKELRVTGSGEELNQELERAARVADFFEFAELLVFDALHRNESCGGHFRVEYQTPEGEAQRNDKEFAYVAAWE